MNEVIENPELIESMDDFFDKSGPMPSGPSDLRRFPRFYFRSCAEALIYPLSGKANAEPTHHFLATSNLSRGGVSLLHKDQLYPGQRLDVILNGEPARPTEVVWCKRLAPARYAVGCQFMKPASGE
jgi:hypothetical protein